MAIKAVSKERIEEALLEFDSHHRSKREWQSWETNQAHRYAIEAEGRLYPPKKIISIATGIAVAEFSGGHPTNSYLQKRGFTLVPLEHPEGEQILQFTPGAVYDRRAEIHGPFGGSQQSGISTSARYPAIFLFTGESGEQYGYSDRWEGGAYLYTGEGQRGSMTLTRGNRAIAEHAEKGRALHLFASLGKGNGYVYKGEFTCADVLARIQPDVLGEDRDALVFRLVPVGVSSESVEAEVGVGDEADLANSLTAARLAALEACKASNGDLGQSAPRKIYQRSRKVAHYVLMRADGMCESCEKPAPFRRLDGTHYLEPHHVNRLSDGGLDHPRYIAALCPSCHREIHSGIAGALKNAQLKRRLEIIEP